MNRPHPNSLTLNNTVVGSYFNGGVRAYSIADPSRPVEIGYVVPQAPAANPTHTIQINDVYVDEHGLIYANDRLTGGLTSSAIPAACRSIEFAATAAPWPMDG